ncbi:hypothetical protein PBY51_022010 [Eleginops maclovinus]|uniref:Uncharacterized protein n=1 Tax=Eleginops maclovinus TaxID=56733 RepID=A0AAN7XJ13_ELEMC|nr:hypothetical protein PBY51_022010 [Eleginops maclovinus]
MVCKVGVPPLTVDGVKAVVPILRQHSLGPDPAQHPPAGPAALPVSGDFRERSLSSTNTLSISACRCPLQGHWGGGPQQRCRRINLHTHTAG